MRKDKGNKDTEKRTEKTRERIVERKKGFLEHLSGFVLEKNFVTLLGSKDLGLNV